MSSDVEKIIDRIHQKKNFRIRKEEAMCLYEQAPLSSLMHLADQIRYIHNPRREVTWQIDRNVNYTNTCISGCLFCNFHCSLKEKEKAYELKVGDYYPKIDELIAKGGHQLLLQGGLHPRFDISYYETLFRALKDYEPSLKLNALGPPEVAHIARISKISIHETLQRLQAAGLDTLPGAGAEILCERVRKIQSPAKPSVEKWIEVMKEAHQMELSTTATMVYGSIETPEERVGHFFTIRDIQDCRPEGSIGFRAFILWPMQLQNTELGKRITEGRIQQPQSRGGISEYIRLISLARIILDNIDHIQASWLTVGIDTSRIALHAGADDLGSIMIEENVVSSTGLENTVIDASRMQEIIRESGFSPRLRDQEYHLY